MDGPFTSVQRSSDVSRFGELVWKCVAGCEVRGWVRTSESGRLKGCGRVRGVRPGAGEGRRSTEGWGWGGSEKGEEGGGARGAESGGQRVRGVPKGVKCGEGRADGVDGWRGRRGGRGWRGQCERRARLTWMVARRGR
jgi:hypothetical protein